MISTMASNFCTKFILPLRSHLIPDTCRKTPLQAFLDNALGKTREFVRDLCSKNIKLPNTNYRSQFRLPAEKSLNAPPLSRFVFYQPGFIHNVTAKWVSDSVAGFIGKEWSRSLLKRGSGPMICFAGFVLAKKPSLLTDEEEHEGVSFVIRDSFATVPWQKFGLNIDKNYGFNKSFSISDLKIGSMIAKGCNAAVYSACFQNENPAKASMDENISENKKRNDSLLSYSKPITLQTLNDNGNSHGSKIFISHSEGEQGNFPKKSEVENAQQSKNVPFLTEKLEPYDLAVKVMFNYSAESNAFAVWNAMYKETLPVMGEFCFEDNQKSRVRKKKLKPHPNIVEMYFAFADQVPLLPGAYKHFPQALPVRLLNDGCGRNMTLFLVMKRYHCCLKDYLKLIGSSPKTSLILFTQLLEALVHLLHNNVTHRDLKTDNILIDLSQGLHLPKLAIADFGCCLDDIQLSYPSYEISKGGNMALMAPEVVNAEAGPFSVIDYSRSDLWTAGTIAYEIFGGQNPFYSKNSNLKSGAYNENCLPALPSDTPPAIQKLVKDMLLINPRERPSPSFAATVCQILLHAPPDLFHQCESKKLSRKVLEWIFAMSSKTFLESSFRGRSLQQDVEFELHHTFCSRIQYLEVIRAFNYILSSNV